MDKLRALKMLLSVIEAGSLSAAARQERVSAPTALRLVAGLERDLGVRLVQRTSRKMSLPEDAQPFVATIRRLLQELQEAEDELKARSVSTQGRLRMTAPVLFGQLHVAPSVARFVARHAQVQVKLMLLDEVVDLDAGSFDVAVRLGRLPDSELVAQAIGQVHSVIVASPDYLRRHGTPRHPRELIDHNCLTYCGPAATAWQFIDAGHQSSVSVRGNLAVNLAAPLLEACAHGAGIARVQSYQAQPWLLSGRLRVILSEYQPAPHDVSLVYPRGRSRLARVRALLEWLRSELPAAFAPTETASAREKP